nr:immunoglobulin light chain junction region [Macaca mulatta]
DYYCYSKDSSTDHGLF